MRKKTKSFIEDFEIVDASNYDKVIGVDDNNFYYFDCTTVFGKIKFFVWKLFHRKYG